MSARLSSEPTIDRERSDALLFVGDLHLGRGPGRLQAAYDEDPSALARLGPAAALRNAIDAAVERRVRAVVFAGDVVDHEKDRFESLSLLLRECRRLQDAGIPCYAVAGNHDVEVLPRLANRLGPGFTLLGAHGNWERIAVPGPGTSLELLGRSFEKPIEREDPTLRPEFAQLANPDGLCLGIVHGELDRSTSPHAPLSRSRLLAARCAAWFLGHYHEPDDFTGPQPIGYLGSLVGLDPGEPGLHGPVLVRIAEGALHCERLPLAPLRWEQVTLTLEDGDVADEDTLDERILRGLHEHTRHGDSFDAPQLRAIAFRVELRGRLQDRSVVESYLSARAAAPRRHPGPDEQDWILEAWIDRTRPDLDLEALATERSPAGHVARLLLELEGEHPPEELLQAARRRLDPLASGRWANATDTELTELLPALRRAGWEALERLLASTSGHGA